MSQPQRTEHWAGENPGTGTQRKEQLLYLSLLPPNTTALSSSPVKTQKQIGISPSPLQINECDRKGPFVFANRRAAQFLLGMAWPAMYSCLGKRARAAEVSWGREATPVWFSPAGKPKTASLLNLTVVHSKNNSGLGGWTKKKACKGEPYSLKALCTVNWFFRRKICTSRRESGKATNLLVGRYIYKHVV